MRYRVPGFVAGGIVAVLAGGITAVGVAGQTLREDPRPAADIPRTPDGKPDLNGVWDYSTTTPLERPARFGDREWLTEDEIEALDRETSEANDRAPREGDPGTYNQFWVDRGGSIGRTSLIIDPPDGRLPPLTPEGQARAARRAAERKQRGPADSWLDRSTYERCITRNGVPALPTGYNNNIQIFQTPNHIAFLMEMMHDPRIISLTGAPHVGPAIRLWHGDARARWEGDTLVVETTNFSDKMNWRGAEGNQRIVERLTMIDANNIDYRFTVEDPTTWTRSWTAVLPLRRAEGPVYEYACHEGNYAMENILRGARAEEAAAAGNQSNR